jgi:hypothetical protein
MFLQLTFEFRRIIVLVNSDPGDEGVALDAVGRRAFPDPRGHDAAGGLKFNDFVGTLKLDLHHPSYFNRSVSFGPLPESGSLGCNGPHVELGSLALVVSVNWIGSLLVQGRHPFIAPPE